MVCKVGIDGDYALYPGKQFFGIGHGKCAKIVDGQKIECGGDIIFSIAANSVMLDLDDKTAGILTSG